MSKEIVFVNAEKHRRAVDIVALVTGKRNPATDHDSDLQAYWSAELEGVKGDAVQFVYEKLGGLVRTPSEEAAAKKRKTEIKASAGKQSKKSGKGK